MHSTQPIGSATSAQIALSTSVFRTGTTSLRITHSSVTLAGTNGQALPIPGGGDATVIVGAALQWDTSNGTSTMAMSFNSDNTSTVHVTVYLNTASGVLNVYRGTNATGTLLGTVTLSGTAMLLNTWNYWEFKCVLSDTVGEVHVRVNSTAVLDLTGLDTKNGGTKTVIDSIVLPGGYGSAGAQTPIVYSDDLYVVTGTGAPNDYLGDCKVSTIYPTGNGDYSQLVGSDLDSTNNYLLVNEAGAPVTTSYVESDTVGQRDFYAMGDISIPSTATVLGVQVSVWANNPDGGSGRSAKLGVRQSTSETLSANQALTAVTFLAARGMFTTDPATGAAWSQAGVNSAQAGVEVG
jgi:hypothetical protein